MSALELNNISHGYDASPAVTEVSFALDAGARLAVVGPSGSGKTTLLRLIAGFEFPHAGTILMAGRTLVSPQASIPAHQRGIGYLPQDGALFPHLSVAGNIGFALQGGPRANRQRIEELTRTVSLDPAMLERWPHELSGGQQQRVALARALAQKPALMLLDEPFSALDTGLRAAMRNAVVQVLNEAGVTAILVTHDQQEALSFATQLAVMRDGRLRQIGAPMDLYLRPDDEQIAGFLGEALFLEAWAQDGFATCALGQIPLSPTSAHGQVRIMLRPEQLRIDPTGATTGHPRTPGRVVASESRGSHCQITLMLAPQACSTPGTAISLELPVPAALAPAIGMPVDVQVLGGAHVMGAPR
jgi:iron(III) transport system ATP-binding protein